MVNNKLEHDDSNWLGKPFDVIYVDAGQLNNMTERTFVCGSFFFPLHDISHSHP